MDLLKMDPSPFWNGNSLSYSSNWVQENTPKISTGDQRDLLVWNQIMSLIQYFWDKVSRLLEVPSTAFEGSMSTKEMKLHWAQSNISFWCEKRIFSLSLPLHCVFQSSRGNNMIKYRASQKKLSFRICPKCPDFPRIAQNAPNCPNIQNWRKNCP